MQDSRSTGIAEALVLRVQGLFGAKMPRQRQVSGPAGATSCLILERCAS